MTRAEPMITLDVFNALLDAHHPFSAVLQARIEEIGWGSARVRLPSHPSHQRKGGIISGPMLMGLADLALYAAVVGASGNTDAVTASLSINFMRKAPPGDVLAIATIHKVGRSAAGDVVIIPADGGEPIAQAISTWAVPRPL